MGADYDQNSKNCVGTGNVAMNHKASVSGSFFSCSMLVSFWSCSPLVKTRCVEPDVSYTWIICMCNSKWHRNSFCSMAYYFKAFWFPCSRHSNTVPSAVLWQCASNTAGWSNFQLHIKKEIQTPLRHFLICGIKTVTKPWNLNHTPEVVMLNMLKVQLLCWT